LLSWHQFPNVDTAASTDISKGRNAGIGKLTKIAKFLGFVLGISGFCELSFEVASFDVTSPDPESKVPCK
jgi:hypothetical protein